MKNFRSLIFLRAFHIMRESSLSWGESLSKSWQIYRLNKELHHGVKTFYFEKKNGEIRKATGTLKIDYQFKTENQPNPKIFSYFDVEAQDFRCFKVENFIMLANSERPKKATLRQKRIRKYLNAA